MVGTVLAFLTSLLHPLLKPTEKLFESYLESHLPPDSTWEATVVLVSLLLMGVILALPRKWWRSLRCRRALENVLF